MKRINFIYYLSILALIVAGIMFVRINRYESTVKVIENLKDKDIVFYTSNYKRLYINTQKMPPGDMEKLCMEGISSMTSGGLNSYYLKNEEGVLDPYAQSELMLGKNLKKDKKYILLDISRAQTRHGNKYKSEKGYSCPISITLSRKSKSYDQSLLFMGRVKSVIDKKYETIPVHIVTVDSEEYNQSRGYIAALVEVGDAANSYDEAKESIRIFCDAMKEIINIEKQQ